MFFFLKFSMAYCCFAVLTVFLTRENPIASLASVLITTQGLLLLFAQMVLVFALAGIAMNAVTKKQPVRDTILAVLFASVGVLFLHGSFTLVKTSLPYIVPFYADPGFALLDSVLHGGSDPWVFAYKLAEVLPMQWILPFYLDVWAWPALLLPLIIAAFDTDKVRIQRIVLLYVMAWIVIGNILALAGMSAGPVFYDRLLGGDRFADLTAALMNDDLAATRFGSIQEFLWQVYSGQGQSGGSGISAFPSVHVSIATVSAIYLYERSRWLAPLGVGFVVIILFLSVYTGYHYAIDGYASILIIVGLWLWMKRRDARLA